MITIAGEPLNRTSDLSPNATRVLARIADGAAWLAWAVDAPRKYAFPDEASLLTSVQGGLHGSPLLLLPRLGLWIGAGRLVALAPDSLQALLRREAGDEGSVVQRQASKVLADERLVTQDDLAAGQKFLADVGVDSPLLRGLTLGEQAALFELVQSSSSGVAMRDDLQREAATFAASRAAAALEFVDLYKIYMVVAAKHGLLDGSAEARGKAVEQSLAALTPGLLAALDCPRLDTPIAPAEFVRRLRGFLAANPALGFPRVTAGVLQLVQYTKFLDETGDQARAFVAAFLQEVRSFMLQSPLAAARPSQDGLACTYTLRGEAAEAELGLDEGGLLTLRTFRGVRPPEPPIAQA
ncbi:MAG: hypothetical protein JNL82_09685 [Myxococcales bacterium]|nr:hypothetical protein [Myxococcales bacterium]